MPLFKTRRAKIEPYKGSGLADTLLVTDVSKPNLDVFNSINTVTQTLQLPKLETNNKYKLAKLLPRRMDEPEEELELLCPLANGHRNSVSLPINKTTLQVNGYPRLRRSIDLSRLELDSFVTPNFFARKENVESCQTTVFKDDILNFHELRDSECTVENRWKLPDIDKTSQLKDRLKQSADRVTKDTIEWTKNPDQCYRYILKLRQERYEQIEASSGRQVDRCDFKPSLFAGNDLEDFHRVRFTPEDVLFSAIAQNIPEELENAIEHCSVDLDRHFSFFDRTLLHMAAERGFTECAQVLLKHGANVNCVDSDSRSPLYMAFKNCHFECAVFLIERGADIRQYTAHRLTEFEHVKRFCMTDHQLNKYTSSTV